MKLLLISGGLLTVSSLIYLLSLSSSLYGSVVAKAPGPAQGTLARVRGTVLRVGYTANSQAAPNSAIGPRGMDTTLITGFARQLAAEVEWVPGNEQQLYHALKNRKIDLLIGNLTEQTPTKDNAARSRPHLENTNYAYVSYKNRGRTSSPRSKPARARSQPASPSTEQSKAVLTARSEPAKANPVIAVPANEKAWLATLEKYISQRQLASTHSAQQ